ncbi:MAG: HD domain-containing protein [Clostridium sp.]|nr:HD domain-containing protein [Clostridium sp.]MCM1400144.1 HD domain-containing protein [Clostridium sp.]MCM1460831.1 HD domain-containing protein [Bacteroides sp.]
MDKIKKILNNERYQYYVNYIETMETDRNYCLHGMEHSLDVARIAYIISLEHNMGIDKELIYAMALLHDIGRAEEYKDGSPHHQAGVDIAGDILDEAGFSESDRNRICRAIACHKNEQTGDGIAELLYKADKLSRKCFDCGAYDSCYWDDEMKNKSIIY